MNCATMPNTFTQRLLKLVTLLFGCLISLNVSAETNYALEVSRPGTYVITPTNNPPSLTVQEINTLTTKLSISEVAHLQGFFFSLHHLEHDTIYKVPKFGDWNLPYLADRNDFTALASEILFKSVARPYFPKIGDKCPSHAQIDNALFEAERHYQTRGKELRRIPKHARLVSGTIFVGYSKAGCVDG